MQWTMLQNLWFALIIPLILILYLLKRKYENKEVASVLLWRKMLQDLEVNRPFQRLWKNLLLFLQLLAAILLILALLKPAVPTDGAIARHTVIVIDSSGSMLAKEGEKTRFALAKEEVQKVIDHLRSDQALTLIEAGREPKVLLSKSADKQALQQALQQIPARMGSSDNPGALSLAKAIATSEPGSGIMWFGDGGSDAFSETDMDGLEASSFRFVQTGKTKENVAIGTFVTQKGRQGTEGLLRIDNHGIQRKRGKVAVYDQNKRLLDVAAFEIPSKENQTVTFSNLKESAAYEAILEVEMDGLAEDNQLWSVPFTAEQTRAVLISPNGNRFLHEVLSIGNRLQVEKMNELPKTTETKKPAYLWVFDGVVPDKLPEGNILLIGPTRSTDWLPFQGVKAVTERSEIAEKDNPLLQYVDWHDVHVAKTAALGEIAGMKGLVKSGQQELLKAGTINGRRVVIIGFDLHQSDLPLRPAFPILMQNALSWLAPVKSTPIGTAYPGEPLTIPLTPGAEKRVLILPDGTAQAIEAEGTSFLYQVPEQVGNYHVVETSGDRTQNRYFSAQMRESESDITPRTVSLSAGQKTDINGKDADQLQLTGMNGYRDFTFWLIMLALIIVFVEWRVYQRGY